uniref:Uncharacterized protein n=1 Tax=Romanomermis culicivorax TaxID=13658 RepID=A0A915HWA4_ROMCU
MGRLSLTDNCPIVSYRGFLYRFDFNIQIDGVLSIEPSKIQQICWSRKDERIYVFCKTGIPTLDNILLVGEIKMLT